MGFLFFEHFGKLGNMPIYPHKGASGSACRLIPAVPEAIYQVISDATRIPEWSKRPY